jgi:hypothetical protein
MSDARRYARGGLWALPAWAGLLFLATLTHQPPYQTEFAAWARYVTTPVFLVSHLVGSILGAAVGVLGFLALAVLLVERGVARLALGALVGTVVGSVLLTAVFGVAAFAQPAIGRAFLAGDADVAALYDDVNGPPLFGTVVPGVLLLAGGLIAFGVAVNRSGLAPRYVGLALIIGGPLFAIVGVVLANAVQSVGAALLLAGTTGVAWAAGPRRSAAAAAP